MTPRRTTVALLFSAAVGCGGSAATGEGADGGARYIDERQDFPIELGTGEATFVPLDDGAALTLVRGFQGLQHVAASVRAWEIPEERYPVSVELLRTGDGARVSEPASTRVPLLATEEGYVEIVGLRAVVEEPAAIVGSEARLVVGITGPDGQVAIASHVGVVEWAAAEE